jgi:SAM-dependent methyltransferase
MTTTRHPAKFSDPVLEVIDALLETRSDTFQDDQPLLIDPFAGVGKIHLLHHARAIGVELEPEWAAMAPGTIVANALHLPFPDGAFDGTATSPCYGSRLADHHNAQDGSVRHSYTHTLGRRLHPDNAGTLHWGDAYRSFHDQAWRETLRVVRPGGFVILNVSNHIRKGVEQPVVEWHLSWFLTHQCVFRDIRQVATRRLLHGANRARSPHEYVIHLAYQPETL